ncbi:MAG: Abi family protein [Clostridium sp.]|uniref:Abi family protein n=1 Tax=Clostridium sp. TaxID=1506 RepID=UPI002A763D68|nr:Abi family protein [Clostridium sp.]MDY2631695.1 Abi family protein [Clostridium sp.]MDY6228580.1 Abi family protein [Clostridium sp.]
MEKINLDIDGQIKHMKETSGITFSLVTEVEAKEFLRCNNFYFKLKSFAKNYDKYNSGELKGKYINLDFAYLQELSRLDMILRKLIINMTLDIEHFAKTKLIYDCSENKLEDGYKIVKEFFDKFPYIKKELDKSKNSYNSISGDLKRKYSENPAIWNLVEMISFGDFIKLYELYYFKYKSKDNYSNSLWSVKCLRNAAAHNNCIINTLKNPYNIHITKNSKVTKYISEIEGLSKENRKNKMKNPIIHDFVVSLYVFNMLVKSKATKGKFMTELNGSLEDRFLENKEYFLKNAIIIDNYKFIKKVVEHFYFLCI